MDLKDMLGNMDIERLYQHVLNLEGVKHVSVAPEGLDKAVEYLYSQFKKYGASVRKQEFTIDGYDQTFINVEAWVGDENEPAVVISAHYDTVYNSTGANDDTAGLAVMLEIARLLASEQSKNGKESVPCVRFVATTLEEGNPVYDEKILASAQKHGIKDEKQRYTSYRIAQIMKKHFELFQKFSEGEKPYKKHSDALTEATEQLADQMPDALLAHMKDVEEINAGISDASGVKFLMGSCAWVDEAISLGKKIKYAICLDEIGRTSEKENTQTLPPALTYDMLETYKVDKEKKIGDWVLFIGSLGTEELMKVFQKKCEGVDLPYGYFHIPLNYEQVKQEFPQSLHSDHVAFLQKDIPVMFMFDTAGWRSPYVGHTMADTIDILDFDQIFKITKAILAVIVDPA